MSIYTHTFLLQDYFLAVQFENNEKKRYCIKPLFSELDSFRSLMDVPGLFEQVKVDAGGYGISWNDEIDLSCNELYYNGISI